VGVPRKEAAGRGKASEQTVPQARHSEKALQYLLRTRATAGWRARRPRPGGARPLELPLGIWRRSRDVG